MSIKEQQINRFINMMPEIMGNFKYKHGRAWLHYFLRFYGIRWLDENVGVEAMEDALYTMGCDRMKVWRMKQKFENDRVIRQYLMT